MKVLNWSIFLLFVSMLAACGGCDDENIGTVTSGRLLVSPDPVAFATVEIGTGETQSVLIINVDADEPLTILELEMRAREGGSADGLSVELPETPFDLEPNEQIELLLTYNPEEGGTPPQAEFVFISTDDRFSREEPKTVSIDALGNQPRLEVIPSTVRFPRLPPGTRENQEVRIRNVGTAPMKIWEEPTYSGGEDFRLVAPVRGYPLTLAVWDSEAAQNRPDEFELPVNVEYAPIGNGADTGEILVYTNDPAGDVDGDVTGEIRTVRAVAVQANADAPCILVDGTTRNLGQVPIGSTTADVVTISNCGSQPLEISNIVLTENSDDTEFSMDLKGWDNNNDQLLDATVTMLPGEEDTFFIKYVPLQTGTDKGKIIINSNDPVQPELELDLVARGSEGICPVADAGGYIRGVNTTPRQNLAAAPLQYIILDGSASSDEDGRVDEYIWEIVSQPPGAAANLGPTQGDPNNQDFSKREMRLLIAGDYVVELRVKDNEGFLNCGDPARVAIRAVPNEKILYELTWTNPEDPDETDDVGSDVDGHLVKMGPGVWFEAPYDIYFRNPNNGAGNETNGLWGPESPSLDIDDRDGGGPENIQMNDPANCEWYAVGAHYYRQLFGTAYATVRIYVNAQLVYEQINKPLSRGGQFWDVARIHWDTGQVYDNSGNLFEASPNGLAPEVTTGMSTSGLCTSQGLYTIQ